MQELVKFIGSRYSNSVTARMEAHTHSYYELNFMTNGRTKMWINGQLFDFGSFDFLLIPPYTPHILNISDSKTYDNFVIWFKATDAGKSFLPTNKIIKLHDYKGIVETLCSEIYRTFQKTKMQQIDLISYYLNAVIYHMNQGMQIDIAQKVETEDPYEKALRYININATYGHVSVKDVAGMMNVSMTHFSRVFKKRFSTTPKEYMINLKIAEAKKLLTETALSIKEIAERLGYTDQLFFSKQFSLKTGSSPKEWRKTYKARNQNNA